jgi:hypothetical protein
LDKIKTFSCYDGETMLYLHSDELICVSRQTSLRVKRMDVAVRSLASKRIKDACLQASFYVISPLSSNFTIHLIQFI